MNCEFVILALASGKAERKIDQLKMCEAHNSKLTIQNSKLIVR